jgi:hypothetical protein
MLSINCNIFAILVDLILMFKVSVEEEELFVALDKVMENAESIVSAKIPKNAFSTLGKL